MFQLIWVLTNLLLQELEDQLQEEEDKVNHLNKVKSKLEQQIDEVCVPSIHINMQIGKFKIKSEFPFVWKLLNTKCLFLLYCRQ